MFLVHIWQSLKGDRHLMAASILFGLIFTGLGIVPPLLVRKMIQWLERPETAGSFLFLGGCVAALYLLRGVTRYLYGLTSHVAAYRTLHRLMNAVYQHLQRMPPAVLNRRHSGNLVSRTIGDVEAIEDFIAHGIPETMLAMVIPITMSVVLFIINWKLALIALFPLPLVAVAIYVLARRTRNYWKHVRQQFGELSGRIQDHVTGLAVIQSFTREAEAARQIRRQSREYRDGIVYANTWSLVPAGVIEASAGAGLVLIVCAGGWIQPVSLSAGGMVPATTSAATPVLHVQVADLVVFLMYLGQIFMPLLRLANLTENLQKASASAERVFEMLKWQPPIADSADARPPDEARFDIEFESVDFEYEAGLPVLQDVSLHIEAGETVALVGETGVGKSTVCQLLVRFYDVDGGSVRLGGHDLRELPLEYVRRHIALVSQDVFLFEGTIRENLLLADPQASDDDMRRAAQAANAEDFILSFPDGYESLVGERGIRLSGGQKQRIAIARALLKDAPVLVLDEATSAVDSETESAIKDALERVTAGRTVLLVAHRLSTIASADRIIVLQKGRVVETGTYDELLNHAGHFTRLCRLQEKALW